MLFALIIIACSATEGCAPVDVKPRYEYHSLQECLRAAEFSVRTVPANVVAMTREVSCKAAEPQS